MIEINWFSTPNNIQLKKKKLSVDSWYRYKLIIILKLLLGVSLSGYFNQTVSENYDVLQY